MNKIYKEQRVEVVIDKYQQGGKPLIDLVSVETREPIARATVNTPVELEKGQFAVLNSGENEGMMQWLEVNGIAVPVNRDPSPSVGPDIKIASWNDRMIR